MKANKEKGGGLEPGSRPKPPLSLRSSLPRSLPSNFHASSSRCSASRAAPGTSIAHHSLCQSRAAPGSSIAYVTASHSKNSSSIA
eukprot:3135091-Rhodomonas_salina.1